MTREQVDAIIANGGVDTSRDTLYRIGSADPTGFFTQSQLNNAMSGTDANAIYQATHDQRRVGMIPQDLNDLLRSEGLAIKTDRQPVGSAYGNAAYVTGADAGVHPVYDEMMEAGAGSPAGIPRELLNNHDRAYADTLQALMNAMGWVQR